jgi:hypothetical protein
MLLEAVRESIVMFSRSPDAIVKGGKPPEATKVLSIMRLCLSFSFSLNLASRAVTTRARRFADRDTNWPVHLHPSAGCKRARSTTPGHKSSMPGCSLRDVGPLLI